MIKDILNNRYFVLILYIIGILFFLKINPYMIGNIKIRNYQNQILIFLILIVIMMVSHYNMSLGLLGTLIFLYLLVIKNTTGVSPISENFQNKEEDDDDDDNNDDEDDNNDDEDENNDDEDENNDEEDEDDNEEESIDDKEDNLTPESD